MDGLGLHDLIESYEPGKSLPGRFFTDDGVFRADLDRVWSKGWIFASHACELAEVGAWIRLDIGSTSVLVVRGEDRVYAHHNVCTHRGSRLCDEARGCAARLVCPYHHWAFDPDGSLGATPGISEGALDRAGLGLMPVDCREVAGLIFVSLDADPPGFDDAKREIDRELAGFELRRAKVAATREYEIRANWKLVFENNRECYHCPGAHPEYCRANFDVSRDRGRRTDQIEGSIESLRRRLESLGLPTEGLNSSSAMTGRWHRANRTPNAPGFVTESLDGNPVSVPMGDLSTVDVGTARVTMFPSFWCHASGDHACTTRLTPVAPDLTRARVVWLVHADALEGRDYDVDALTPFWARTSEQDWALCERQQRGVSSPAYRPGPLHPALEAGVVQFDTWYLDALRGDAHAWEDASTDGL